MQTLLATYSHGDLTIRTYRSANGTYNFTILIHGSVAGGNVGYGSENAAHVAAVNWL